MKVGFEIKTKMPQGKFDLNQSQIQKQVEKAMLKALKIFKRHLESEISAYTDTGEAKGSIVIKVEGNKGFVGWEGNAVDEDGQANPVKYMAILNYGTANSWDIQPVRARRLLFSVEEAASKGRSYDHIPKTSDGKFYAAQKVTHPRMEGRMFLQRAWEASKTEIQAVFKQELGVVLKVRSVKAEVIKG